MKMKYTLMIGAAAMTCLTLGAATDARAQETVVQTTTTRDPGTISEFGPDEMIVRSETLPEPIRYGVSKTTTYVDEDGVPVAVEQVKTGVPVTVEYSRVGDRLVARRVIVRRTITPGGTVIQKKTTTTTTTERR
jgi:hypothetical protein